ncbi:MAG: lysostaphin resistance A-like protein [Candidatus Sericytochromatia bacterium]
MTRLRLFLALSFGLSWFSMPLFLLLGGYWNSPAALIFSMGYMWVPGLCALGLQGLSRRPLAELGLRWTPNHWWLAAWLGPPVLALLTLGMGLLMPGVEFSWQMRGLFARLAQTLPSEVLEQMRAAMLNLPVPPILVILIQGLFAGATLNTLAALGEELGWRGLLYRELDYLGFWRASGLIGAIWGLWHAPLILQGHNYPEHPQAGVVLMILWCMLLSPWFSLIRLKSRGVWAPALLHGTLNGSFGLSLSLLSGGSDLLVGMTGLAGLLVLAGLDLALFVAAPDLRRGSLEQLQAKG